MCITHRHYLNTQRNQIRLTEAILLRVISDFQVPNFAFFVVFKCKAFFFCVYILKQCKKLMSAYTRQVLQCT